MDEHNHTPATIKRVEVPRKYNDWWVPTINWWRVLWWSLRLHAAVMLGGGASVLLFEMWIAAPFDDASVAYFMVALGTAFLAMLLWVEGSFVPAVILGFIGIIWDKLVYAYEYIEEKADL